METTITCNFEDITEGKLVKEVLLQGMDVETDFESLKSLDLYTIINPPKGTDPDSPYVFDI